jgi:tetratricopeptide (TPR) repeat protein
MRAVAIEREILDTAIRDLGPDHPGLAGDYLGLAIALAHVRRFDEAIANGERGVALREIATGPASHDLAVSLNNLGGMFLMASAEHPVRVHDAMRTLERAREIAAKVDGDDAPLTLQIGLGLASAYADDQPAHAAALYQALLPRLERSKVTDKTLASARKYYAHILLALGRFADSAAQSRRAIPYYERVAEGKPTLDLGICLVDLAAAQQGLHDSAAVETARRALPILRDAHASPAATAQAEMIIDRVRRSP